MPRIVRGRAAPGELDRRQGIDDPEARGARARGGEAGRPGDALPGAVLRPLLLPGPGRRSTTRYTEQIPDGPTTKRMQDLAKQTGMVLVVPMYEEDDQASGIYYNTAAVIDADGKYLGKYRKTHIPHVKGFWEKFYFRPGNMGYPVFETAVGKVGVYICYDRHFPEGARALGLNGAEMVFIPSATSRGLSRVPVAHRAGLARRRQRLLRRARSTGSASRRTSATTTSTARATSCDPRGQFIGAVGDAARRGAARPGHGPRPDPGGPPDLAVLPRPPARRVRGPRPRPRTGRVDAAIASPARRLPPCNQLAPRR